MIFINVFIISLISFSIWGSNIEPELLRKCSNNDLKSCEILATFYVKNDQHDKSILLGDALCKKDIAIGCTIRGISLISKKDIRSGTQSLNFACDKFEPYACRTLARLMKTAGAIELSHVYFRKACHFGLSEICSDLKKNFKFLTTAGDEFMKSLPRECSDTVDASCTDKVKMLSKCEPPLEKKDCEIIPSLLNIFFRAKLIQAEAKLLLTKALNAQKSFKLKSPNNKYSFSLSELFNKKSDHPKYHYVFGFQKACSSTSKYSSIDLFPDSYSHLPSSSLQFIKKELSRLGKQECYDPKWGFEIFAIASLDPLNPKVLDVWKINQDGNLIHSFDGAPIQ